MKHNRKPRKCLVHKGINYRIKKVFWISEGKEKYSTVVLGQFIDEFGGKKLNAILKPPLKLRYIQHMYLYCVSLNFYLLI